MGRSALKIFTVSKLTVITQHRRLKVMARIAEGFVGVKLASFPMPLKRESFARSETTVAQTLNLDFFTTGVGGEPTNQSRRGSFSIQLQRTLPNYCNAPAFASKCQLSCPIPRRIRLELGKPELGTGFRRRCISTVGVPVPKATVDEDHRVPLPEDDVRRPREISLAKAEPEAVRME
jgi:hypothetical protein